MSDGGFLLKISWLRGLVPVRLRSEKYITTFFYILNNILHILNHCAALEWTKWTGMLGIVLKRRITFFFSLRTEKQIKTRCGLTVTAYDVAITGTLTKTFERQRNYCM